MKFSKIKITPVTVNKFYSINNINITNGKLNNNRNNNDLGTLTRNKRGISLDDNYNLSQKSRNYLNDDYAQQQGNCQVQNNQESSCMRAFPIRKLDFKDESNIKLNYANLKSSNDNNFIRNDLVNFSDIRFQSCKSKIE